MFQVVNAIRRVGGTALEAISFVLCDNSCVLAGSGARASPPAFSLRAAAKAPRACAGCLEEYRSPETVAAPSCSFQQDEVPKTVRSWE